MSHTYKTFAQNAMVQDFRNKGTFQSKDEILARVNVSTEEQKQDDVEDSINADDLFDFRKVVKDNSETKNPLDAFKTIPQINDELNRLTAKEIAFDFKTNAIDKSRETELKKKLAALESMNKDDYEFIEKLEKNLLFKIITIALCVAFIPFTAKAVFHSVNDFVMQPSSQALQVKLPTTETVVTISEDTLNAISNKQMSTDQLVSKIGESEYLFKDDKAELAKKIAETTAQKAPVTKEQFNAMLLDGIAKQNSMTTKQLQEQTPPQTMQQISRIGQTVLELAHINNKGDEK